MVQNQVFWAHPSDVNDRLADANRHGWKALQISTARLDTVFVLLERPMKDS